MALFFTRPTDCRKRPFEKSTIQGINQLSGILIGFIDIIAQLYTIKSFLGIIIDSIVVSIVAMGKDC